MTYNTDGSSATVVTKIAKKIVPNSADAGTYFRTHFGESRRPDHRRNSRHRDTCHYLDSSRNHGERSANQRWSENWYSPELKTTVMTKHSDPWPGN